MSKFANKNNIIKTDLILFIFLTDLIRNKKNFKLTNFKNIKKKILDFLFFFVVNLY